MAATPGQRYSATMSGCDGGDEGDNDGVLEHLINR
jgi:hypothetical protein